jgi:hypothetical protein
VFAARSTVYLPKLTAFDGTPASSDCTTSEKARLVKGVDWIVGATSSMYPQLPALKVIQNALRPVNMLV